MKYIISRKSTDGRLKYIYKDTFNLQWTEEKSLALRMSPEKASSVSYLLMQYGISHSIKQMTR